MPFALKLVIQQISKVLALVALLSGWRRSACPSSRFSFQDFFADVCAFQLCEEMLVICWGPRAAKTEFIVYLLGYNLSTR
jgi:hypothetical protein